VFFSTDEALVPEDVNGKYDAYEYDVASRTVHLLSTGTGTSDSFFMDADASGDNAYILTRQRLVGWDTDGAVDIYDVRVGGGFPEPPPVTVGECGAGTCQGAGSAAPVFDAPASLTVAGAGNAPPTSAGKPLSRAQRLARALRACRHKRSRTARRKCEAAAHRRFGKASRVGRGK
jgi:hypothetical protein